MRLQEKALNLVKRERFLDTALKNGKIDAITRELFKHPDLKEVDPEKFSNLKIEYLKIK